jgi:uncharacterized GH25 family protein/hydrogenase/urease accessory protein HupE
MILRLPARIRSPPAGALPFPGGGRAAWGRIAAAAATAACVASALAAVTPAAAHEHWLAATRSGPAPHDTVEIRAWVGTGFRGEPKAYAARRARRFEVHAARTIDLRPLAVNGDLVFARLLSPDAGGSLVVYESDFAALALDGGRFDDYLREEGLAAPLAARARANPGPVRERYARCCKTWIAGSDATRAARVTGMPLELIPLDDLMAAGPQRFRVLRDGRPLAGALVRAWNQSEPASETAARDSVTPAAALRSDAGGIVRLVLNGTGAWLVSTVHMEPSASAEADWQSHWASFTFARPAAMSPARGQRAPRKRRRRTPQPLRRPRARLGAWGVALALACAPQGARAHAEPYSWIELRFGSASALQGQVTAHVEDLARAAGFAVQDSLLVPSFVKRHRDRLEQALAARLRLQADGVAATPQWRAAHVVDARAAVRLEFTLASSSPGSLRFDGPLFPADPAHETFFNVYAGDVLVHQDLLDHEHTSSVWSAAGTAATRAARQRAGVVRRFVIEGVHHIFIGPDHILFIVALLLLGGGLHRLLRIVTAFTLAHSVTLALAATGVLTPPARIVESVIALSIVWVGADNLWRGGAQRRDHRIAIAATFGLVHGFGFASVLGDLGLPREALAWSLLAFNLGVEIGQACIVLVAAPLLGALHARRPRWARGAVAAGSAVVVAAGTWWFVERALLA